MNNFNEQLKAKYNPENSELRNLQYNMLDIMVEFDSFAKKHELSYSLAFGTLIGAIRHHGFIPWDDDADIMMTRQEWDSFKQYVKDGNLTDTLKIRTLVHPELYIEGKGIVDIFIFDYAPKNKLFDWIKSFLCILLTILIKCKNRIVNKKYKPIKKWFVLMPLAALFRLETLARLKDKIAKWFTPKNMKPSDNVCAYTGVVTDIKIKHKYELLLGEKIEKNFEGHKLSVIPHYHLFLKRWYGDYMQIPTNPTTHGRID